MISSRFESWSLTFFEAWQHGRAVIATRVGAIPDFAHDGVNALLVDVGDIDGLAAAITQLIDNPDLCVKLGEAGRLAWEQLPSWSEISDRYLDVYRGAMRG